MAKRRQRPKKKEKQDLLSTYTDPRAPGALGGLRRFARAQRLSQAQARDCVTEKFDLHVTPSAPSTVQDGARNGLEHQSTMGRRSGGNATLLVSEPGRAVPVDGDRRVVQIRVGPPHQTQDGCRTLESL